MVGVLSQGFEAWIRRIKDLPEARFAASLISRILPIGGHMACIPGWSGKVPHSCAGWWSTHALAGLPGRGSWQSEREYRSQERQNASSDLMTK